MPLPKSIIFTSHFHCTGLPLKKKTHRDKTAQKDSQNVKAKYSVEYLHTEYFLERKDTSRRPIVATATSSNNTTRQKADLKKKVKEKNCRKTFDVGSPKTEVWKREC